MVLAERETSLEKLGFDSMEFPDDFWETLTDLPTAKRVPREATQAIQKMLPDRNLEYSIVQRKAGMGSLGQQRFVAIAQFDGGSIAREAKAMLPSACVWLKGKNGYGQSYYQQTLQSAIRSRDPFQQIIGSWLIRRLSPDSNQIDIQDLPAEHDEELLLCAMGSEAANVHLGTKAQTNEILEDLRTRKSKWLRKSAKDMAKAIEREWKDYRKS